MRRIDRLILGELAGPWGFGVAIFTVLIMAGSWLFKITDYFVSGISFWTVMYFTALLLPGVLVKTFSMAVLLASLLAFGRLSSDSEIVALRAAGASIGRIMVPVAAFSFIVALAAFATNETLVPMAAFRATALKKEIEKKISGGNQPLFYPITENGELRAMIMAQDFNLQARTLKNATVVTYDKDKKPTYILLAEGMKFEDVNNWRVTGTGRLIDYNAEFPVTIKDMWPGKIAQPPDPEDLAAQALRDLDSFSMEQMEDAIRTAKLNPGSDPAQIANLEYGYYNKIALPLSAMIFALVGAPLGIRSHRTGAAAGFWISVLIIFSYMMLANLMAIYAQGGKIPSYMASFAPLVIGAVYAAYLIRKKNV